MPSILTTEQEARLEVGSATAAGTMHGVRIDAPWNAPLTAAGLAAGRRPVEAQSAGATLIERLCRSLEERCRSDSSQAHAFTAWHDARIAMAAETLWGALERAAQSLARRGAAWVVEPLANGALRVAEVASAQTLAVLSLDADASSASRLHLEMCAAAIALLPTLSLAPGRITRAQWECAKGQAEEAARWAGGAGDFMPQDANVLWVSSEARERLEGVGVLDRVRSPVTATVPLGQGDALWVSAERGGARLTLVDSDGDDVCIRTVPGLGFVDRVHHLAHQGRYPAIAVVPGGVHADTRTTLPLRAVLAGHPAPGSLQPNRPGMLTVAMEDDVVRVRALVAGLSEPICDTCVATEALGEALGPMVLRRFECRRAAGIAAPMVLAPHEVALMRGWLAEAIDAAGVAVDEAPTASSRVQRAASFAI